MIIEIRGASSCKEPGVDRRAQHTSRTIPKGSAIRKRAKCALRPAPGDLTRTAFGSFPAYKPGKKKKLILYLSEVIKMRKKNYNIREKTMLKKSNQTLKTGGTLC